MPPEKITNVLVLDLEGSESPVAIRYTAKAAKEFLVKWYPVKGTPNGFQPVAGGVVFVPEEVDVSCEEGVPIQSTPRSCRYRDEFDMLVLTLPHGTTLSWRHPPRATKEHEGRLALYWLSDKGLSEIVWKLSPTDRPAGVLAKDINTFLEDERGDVPVFSLDDYAHYDVALSYAGENREVAAQIAERLMRAGLHIFFDDRERTKLLGRELGPELHAIYSKRSTFCVVLVSKYYSVKRWPIEELKAAVQGMALTRRRDAIIPVKLDDAVLDELPADIVYLPLPAGHDVRGVTATIIDKVRGHHPMA